MLTREDKLNVVLIKKIMTEKETTLPSLRKQRVEKSQSRNRKSKQIITDYPNVQNIVKKS